MHAFIEQLAKAKEADQLSVSLAQYFAQQGINSMAVTYYQQHIKTGLPLIYDWVSPALKPWHCYYLDQQYADSDRTLELTGQSLMPVFWDVYQQLLAAKNTREKRMREESIQFGIRQGLCIPVRGPRADLVNIVLHQRVQEKGLADWQEKQFQWMGIAQTYSHFLREILRPPQIHHTHLSKREKECLALTAKGLRTEAIAAQLKISQRTVHFHLQNANKKMGVNNKYLAIMAINSS